jgi:hypothetical protein
VHDDLCSAGHQADDSRQCEKRQRESREKRQSEQHDIDRRRPMCDEKTREIRQKTQQGLAHGKGRKRNELKELAQRRSTVIHVRATQPDVSYRTLLKM